MTASPISENGKSTMSIAAFQPLTVDAPVGALLDNEAAQAVLARHVPLLVNGPGIDQARGLTLRALQHYVPDLLGDDVLRRIDEDLAREPTAVADLSVVQPPPAPPKDAFALPIERLWSGDAPMARGERTHDVPTLAVIWPDPFAANRGAVIVAPGGGYEGLSLHHEGRMVGDWFAALGFTAFVLTYRLGSFGYPYPVPLHDGRRAVRWVRANAQRFSIDPRRVGMAGFSAGAHLTAMVSTLFDDGHGDAEDVVDRVTCRPDFAVLAYPAITTPLRALQGDQPTPQGLKEMNPSLNVRADTPPTFIFHTTADSLIAPENALAYYGALIQAHVPAELHIFAEGVHGLGLAQGHPSAGAWPGLLRTWLSRQSLLGGAP
jgi:acetyl esterase/lipase